VLPRSRHCLVPRPWFWGSSTWASLQPSLPTLTGIRADYLKGVTEERLVVLDLERILADPKIVVHEEVDS
jgi:chemotaxis signal transduction protein